MRVYFAFAFVVLLWQLCCVSMAAGAKKKPKANIKSVYALLLDMEKVIGTTTVLNNLECLKTSDCTKVSPNSICNKDKEKCQCKPKYGLLGEDKRTCFPLELEMYTCTKNSECTIVSQNSECNETVCKCESGYDFVGEDKLNCVLSDISNVTCKSNAMCKWANTMCKNMKCQCEEGYSNKEDSSVCTGPCTDENKFLIVPYVCDDDGNYGPLQYYGTFYNTSTYVCMTKEGVWLDDYVIYEYELSQHMACACALKNYISGELNDCQLNGNFQIQQCTYEGGCLCVDEYNGEPLIEQDDTCGDDYYDYYNDI